MTKTEKVLSTIIKAVNCLMFLIEAVSIWFMGAHSVGFQTDFESLTIGWALIIVSIALLLAAILIWTSKFSVLFWITVVVLVAGFIALTLLRVMTAGLAFDVLGSAIILFILRYGKFTKPYAGPIMVVAINLTYIYLLSVPYDWFFNYWFTK